MTVFEEIKNFSKIRGMSLNEVAIKSGLSQNAIYNWKNKQPEEINATSLLKIAKVLNVTYKDLTGVDEKFENDKSFELKSAVDDDDFFLTYQGKELSETDKELIKRIFEGKE